MNNDSFELQKGLPYQVSEDSNSVIKVDCILKEYDENLTFEDQSDSSIKKGRCIMNKMDETAPNFPFYVQPEFTHMLESAHIGMEAQPMSSNIKDNLQRLSWIGSDQDHACGEPISNHIGNFELACKSKTEPPSPQKKRKKISQRERKLLRQSGLEYVNRKGNLVKPKAFKQVGCNCRFRCQDNFPLEERKEVYDKFWGSKCWQAQSNFIIQTVLTRRPKRRTVENSRVQNVRRYFLNNKAVCQKVYLSTLSITHMRVDYCLKNKIAAGMSAPDKRGQATPNKTPEKDIEQIKCFLAEMPKYQCTSSQSTKVYFHPELTKSQIYNLYKTKFGSLGRIVSKAIFTRVLKESDIGIYDPKTGACQYCNNLDSKSKSCHFEESVALETRLLLHCERAGAAQKELEGNREFTKPNPTFLSHYLSNLGVACRSSAESSSTKKKRKKKFLSQEERKILRQSGLEYTNQKGKVVKPRTFRFVECNCRFGCYEILPTEERKEIYEKFWGSKSWQAQSDFIIQTVSTSEPKRRTVEHSRIQNVRHYSLNFKQVCQKVYLATLSITHMRVDYCLKNKISSGICAPDRRGQVTPNKTPEEDIERVQHFLDGMPKYHCSSSQSHKLYFHPELSKSQLYDLYKNQLNPAEKILSKAIFTRVLKESNVRTYDPKCDYCQYCDYLNNRIKNCHTDERVALDTLLQLHCESAKIAQRDLQENKDLAKSNPWILSFSFNLEITQLLPHLHMPLIFYKNQVCLYNLGINRHSDNQGYMHVWTETEGNRGPGEICSSIFAFLQSQDLSNVRGIRTFSDCCRAQRSDQAFLAFVLWFCEISGIYEWEHTFLEPCRSFLPNNSDNAHIDKMKKMECIYSLSDWLYAMRTAKLKKPIEIAEMKNRFKNFDHLMNQRQFKTISEDGSAFNWHELRWFKASRGSETISYRMNYSIEEPIRTISFPFQKGLNLSAMLPQADHLQLKVSKDKYLDVLSLFRHIPPIHQVFFLNMPHDD